MLTFVITSVTIFYVPILVVGIRRMPYRSGILSAQLIRREQRTLGTEDRCSLQPP